MGKGDFSSAARAETSPDISAAQNEYVKEH